MKTAQVKINAIDWLNKTVYEDKCIKREVHLDSEQNRVFFFADSLDFDKDDKIRPRHYLDSFDGWKEEYLPHIKWYIL